MTKNEMLQQLKTNEMEWNSYLAKTSKFVNHDLDEGERSLHRRLYSETVAPVLTAATPSDIELLFAAQSGLVGVITSKNTCNGRL